MSKVTPPATRARIAKAYQEGARPQAIATRYRISRQTVVNIAKAAGVYHPAPQLPTQDVTRARERRLEGVREKRLELMEGFVDDAVRLRGQLFAPVAVYKFGGKDNTYASKTIDEPDFDGKLKLATTIGILVDKSITIEKTDLEEDAGAKAAVVSLVDILRKKREEATAAARRPRATKAKAK